MAEPVIGVIGGSGLYEMEGLTDLREERVTTPFGEPSDAYVLGRLDGHPIAFLARHGRGHRFLPSELNFRANIYGFKALGAQWIISASAVGSMREELRPLDIVIPDQFFDRTRGRVSTFFGDGLVAHVGFADPLCPHLSDLLYAAGTEVGATMHKGGTYLCMEGPQFSTRAESRIYRSWGVDVIGMTNLQEAKLSREAEICYATMALVTDYDVWHDAEEDVTVERVVAILHKNVATAKAIIKGVVPRIPVARSCVCAQALKDAIITAPQAISEAAKKKLWLLIGKYLERRSP
jgi:5'-methylthioadenosine phosphorylase